MTSIEIRQTHFEFANIEPRYDRDPMFTFGVPERRARYALPDGYSLDGDDEIRDDIGYLCAIGHDVASNGPKLISMAGPRGDKILRLA